VIKNEQEKKDKQRDKQLRKLRKMKTGDSDSGRWCSNMADDEQAIVLTCTSLVVFMLLHTQILFVLSNEIN